MKLSLKFSNQFSAPFSIQNSKRLFSVVGMAWLAHLGVSQPALGLESAAIAQVATSTQEASSTQLVRKYDVRADLQAYEYRLKNGLTVLVIPNNKAPLTAVYHWVKAGSLHETPGITGIAHLFEHMMFRPQKVGEPGFMDAVRTLGGNANASTSFESTVYTTTVPTKNLEALLAIESSRFKNMKVTDALLDVERKAVWSEYSTKFDSDPITDLWYNLYKSAYVKHPFGWTIIGYREDLNGIKAKNCNTFFEKYYTPNNVGLVISGNVDAPKTLEWVEKAYGDWKPGPAVELPPAYRGPEKYSVTEGKLPSQNKQVLVGYRIPYLTSANIDSLFFINHVLFDSGFNLAKRRLVDKSRVAAEVSGYDFDGSAGMMTAYMSLLPGKTPEMAIKELAKLQADFDAISDNEFGAYLKEYQVSQAEGLLRNESVANAMAMSWGKFNDANRVAEWSKKPMPLKKQDISTVLKKMLRTQNTTAVSTKN